jgi:predicted DNA-binding transcriptional regulator AlpA
MPSTLDTAVTAPLRFLRQSEVERICGLSGDLLLLLEKRGEFPVRVPLSSRAVGWVEAEVLEWTRQRIALRDDAAEAARLKLARAPLPARQRLQARRRRVPEPEETAGPV